MSHSANGGQSDGRRGLAGAFHFLLADSAHATHEAAGAQDLQRLLSTARQEGGPDAGLRERLAGTSGILLDQERGRIESSRQAILILDENRFVRCISARAKLLLALRPESCGQVFPYFFQPGEPLLIHIERPDGKAGVGRLLAVAARWEGKAAYLITIEDITPG